MKIFRIFLLLLISITHLYSQHTFVNVTASMGINEPGASYGQAASWCDIDNDNDLDLAFSYSSGGIFRLYRNDNTVFTDITASSGLSSVSAGIIIWADIDNDNYSDLILGDELYINNNNNTFTDITSSSGMTGYICAAADFDNNGFIDLVSLESQCSILYNDSASFTSSLVINGNFLTAACFDYDLDNNIDIYLGSDGDNKLFKNNGDSTFSDMTSVAGVNCNLNTYAATTGDFNNDGYPDLYIGNHKSQISTPDNRLYKNNGNNTFSNISTSAGVTGNPDNASTRTVSFVDYNNDGYLDIFINDHYKGNMLFRNNQNETFTDVAASMNITGGFGDYFGTAWGDYNNDGAIDIFVAGHYHIYRLYKNNNCQGNYLILNLRGQQSNQNAVGAKVNLWCNIGTLTRFVKAGEGENDFHSLDVEFGLDTCNIIDSFKVNWPSGHIQKFYNISANQIININENDTSVYVEEINNNIQDLFFLTINKNPFYNFTQINYFLPHSLYVDISIYDISGKLIKTLVSAIETGTHSIIWNGDDLNGITVNPGVYFLKFTSQIYNTSKPIIFLR